MHMVRKTFQMKHRSRGYLIYYYLAPKVIIVFNFLTVSLLTHLSYYCVVRH